MDPIETQTPAPAPVEPKKRSSVGGVIAILVILALVIAGAFYMWSERVSRTGISPEEQAALESIEQQDASTDAAAIEADLAAEDPDSFDEDFDRAYAELDAAFEGQ